MTKAYVRIYGRVFNVGFRRYVHRYAVDCKLKGYVENDHADGSVHIVAEGEEKDLERFTLLSGEGTPYSFIANMKIEAVPVTGEYNDFHQIR